MTFLLENFTGNASNALTDSRNYWDPWLNYTDMIKYMQIKCRTPVSNSHPLFHMAEHWCFKMTCYYLTIDNVMKTQSITLLVSAIYHLPKTSQGLLKIFTKVQSNQILCLCSMFVNDCQTCVVMDNYRLRQFGEAGQCTSPGLSDQKIIWTRYSLCIL